MDIGGIDLWYETSPGAPAVDADELASICASLLKEWPDAVVFCNDGRGQYLQVTLKDSSSLWDEGCELFIFRTPEAAAVVGEYNEMLAIYCSLTTMSFVVELPWLALGKKLIIESADRMKAQALNYKKGTVVPVERT